jgi:enoyl-CoA hydratase/carnithine racemase
MSYQDLLVEREGAVVVLRLNRPTRRNALSLNLLRELKDALGQVGADASARAVILASTGKVFSSGHDLGEMTGRSITDYREIFQVCSETMALIQRIPQPVIAEVQGLATAAGCQLAASCDLAIASEPAGFATPGVKIGLFCTTPMVALTRTIGRKRAMEMLLTGRVVDAATACEWGLVNRVVAAEALAAETRALAASIGEASSFTIGAGKQAFYAQADMPQHLAYAYANEVMTMNAMASDAQEGITAFLEKRPPSWKGC